MTGSATDEDGGGDDSGQRPDLIDLVDQLEPDEDSEPITVGGLLSHFDGQAHGPLLVVPGLLAVSPVGAIPGMSLAMGAVITLVAVQMMVRNDRPWLPGRIEDFEMPRDKLRRTVQKMRPIARWLDRMLVRRLSWLVDSPGRYLLATVCALLGLSMAPLALVPMAVAVPGTAVTLLGLGLTLRNGLLALVGYLVCLGAFSLVAWTLIGW